MKSEEQLKKDIKSISDNIGVPIIYIESAIKGAISSYNSSNIPGKTGYVDNKPSQSLSESLFGIKLF